MRAAPGPHLPTVRDVVAAPPLLGARVIAGEAGLDAAVTGVNIAEVPDVPRWLRGGELLFTSGFAWREEPARMTEAVAELERVGVKGLGVKLGTHLRRLPPETLALADELDLPVIEVPAHVAYMDVIEPLLSRLADYRLWEVDQVATVRARLAAVGIGEGSIERACGVVADHLGVEVHLLDQARDTHVAAHPRGMAPAVGGPGPDELAQVSLHQGPDARLATGRPYVGVALPTSPDVRGRLVAIGAEPEQAGLARQVLGALAETVSALAVRRAAIAGARREMAGVVVRSLVHDRVAEDDARVRAALVGIDLDAPMRVLLVHPSERGDPDDGRLPFAVGRGLGDRAHVTVADDAGLLVIAAEPASADGDDTDARAEGAAAAVAAVAEAEGIPVLVAVAPAAEGLAGLLTARSQAVVALAAGRRRRATGPISFGALGTDRILAQVPDGPEVRGVVASVLAGIAHDDELIRTLEIFFAHGGRKAQTAAAVPLHRSTLDYRLDKIATLLGIDLDDPERRLELQLALRLRRMLGPAPTDAPPARVRPTGRPRPPGDVIHDEPAGGAAPSVRPTPPRRP